MYYSKASTLGLDHASCLESVSISSHSVVLNKATDVGCFTVWGVWLKFIIFIENVFWILVYLGLSDSILIEIHRRNQERNDETRGSEMLAMWLEGPEKKRNKHFLQRALLRLTPQPVLLSDTSGK